MHSMISLIAVMYAMLRWFWRHYGKMIEERHRWFQINERPAEQFTANNRPQRHMFASPLQANGKANRILLALSTQTTFSPIIINMIEILVHAVCVYPLSNCCYVYRNLCPDNWMSCPILHIRIVLMSLPLERTDALHFGTTTQQNDMLFLALRKNDLKESRLKIGLEISIGLKSRNYHFE